MLKSIGLSGETISFRLSVKNKKKEPFKFPYGNFRSSALKRNLSNFLRRFESSALKWNLLNSLWEFRSSALKGTFQISCGNLKVAQKKRALQLSFFASFSSIPAVGAELVFVQANRFDHIVKSVVAQGCEL